MATNRDLLKEAIADAKAVKHMAIANAKTALEEAFTPRLKEMLSAKIQEMDEGEEETVKEDGFGKNSADAEEGFGDTNKALDEVDLEELLAELEEEEKDDEPLNEAEEEEEEEVEVDSEESEEEGEEEGEPLDLEDMTDEDLKKMIEDVIADMVASGELEGGDVEGEEGEEIEVSDEEEEVDLAELLKEIEDEMENDMISEDKSPLDNPKEFKVAVDKFTNALDSGKLKPEDLPTDEEIERVITPSDISDIKSSLEEALMLHEGDEEKTDEAKGEAKEKIDAELAQLAKTKKVARIAKILGISLLAAALIVSGMWLPAVMKAAAIATAHAPGVMTAAGVKLAAAASAGGAGIATAVGGASKEHDIKQKERGLKKQKALEEELYEAKKVIKSLKSKINEAVKTTNSTNLLNAKLLYTNKIFKSKNLNESQKVKVLSSFDKANTVKETKLVYETLSEGLKVKKSTIRESLGRASKTTTIPTTKKPIMESNEVFARMQKLAGIIK